MLYEARAMIFSKAFLVFKYKILVNVATHKFVVAVQEFIQYAEKFTPARICNRNLGAKDSIN